MYVMSNGAMPGLVKVGMSRKLPQDRAEEMGAHEALPAPMVVEYYVLVEGTPRDVERAAHRRLAAHGIGKEWFKCSVDIAVAAIQFEAGERKRYERFAHVDRLRSEQALRKLEQARQAAETERQRNDTIKSEREKAKGYIQTEFRRLEPLARSAYGRHTSHLREIGNLFAEMFSDDPLRGLEPLDTWPVEDILVIVKYNEAAALLRKIGIKAETRLEGFGYHPSVPRNTMERINKEFERRKGSSSDKRPFEGAQLYQKYRQYFE